MQILFILYGGGHLVLTFVSFWVFSGIFDKISTLCYLFNVLKLNIIFK
jgi:hypothetical protein